MEMVSHSRRYIYIFFRCGPLLAFFGTNLHMNIRVSRLSMHWGMIKELLHHYITDK